MKFDYLSIINIFHSSFNDVHEEWVVRVCEHVSVSVLKPIDNYCYDRFFFRCCLRAQNSYSTTFKLSRATFFRVEQPTKKRKWNEIWQAWNQRCCFFVLCYSPWFRNRSAKQNRESIFYFTMMTIHRLCYLVLVIIVFFGYSIKTNLLDLFFRCVALASHWNYLVGHLAFRKTVSIDWTADDVWNACERNCSLSFSRCDICSELNKNRILCGETQERENLCRLFYFVCPFPATSDGTNLQIHRWRNFRAFSIM